MRKKKWIFTASVAFLILLLFMLLLSGCKETERVSLKGRVLEVKEKYILIEPLEEELSADKITVSTQVKNSKKVPELEEGDCVKIFYDGIILESYPAKINQVYEIQLIDEKKAVQAAAVRKWLYSLYG